MDSGDATFTIRFGMVENLRIVSGGAREFAPSRNTHPSSSYRTLKCRITNHYSNTIEFPHTVIIRTRVATIYPTYQSHTLSKSRPARIIRELPRHSATDNFVIKSANDLPESTEVAAAQTAENRRSHRNDRSSQTPMAVMARGINLGEG